MPIQKSTSTQSVQDFRAAVAASFVAIGAVLLNVIYASAVGPRPKSPVEITDSALFAYGHNSLYQALRRAADALGEDADSEDWLLELGWNKPEVKPRGKSPGRAKGATQKPRQRFEVYRVGAQ